MEIPKQLKIGGHVFDVVLEKSDYCGETFIDKNKIIIDSELPQSQKEATLIHEIFHCINTTFDDQAEHYIGHSLINSLAEQLYQVLKDNNLLT